MNNRVRHLLLPLAALALLALAPAAVASPGAVVRDCAQDGSLDGSYSDADKRAALGQIPADLDEYSDCRSMISGSIGSGGGGGGGNVTATASSAGTPGVAEKKSPGARKAAAHRTRKAREARRKRARKEREREFGARAVDPRDAGVFKAANTANGMPLPVTLALIALGLMALASALLALWRRNPAFAGALRRVTPRRFRR
jgi:hypothetical protein